MHDEHILQFFEYGHLPHHLQAVSKPFYDLVKQLPQRDLALGVAGDLVDDLVETKDAAVRAILAREA